MKRREFLGYTAMFVLGPVPAAPLEKTSKNYYDLPEGISTAADELKTIRSYESRGEDPRRSAEFMPLFSGEETFLWTRTGLRVPKGWEDGRSDNGKYPRIILIGGKETELIHLPYSPGYVITEFHDSGVPKEVVRRLEHDESGEARHKNPYALHFWFEPRRTDEDTAVAINGCWENCFAFGMQPRSYSFPGRLFRT